VLLANTVGDEDCIGKEMNVERDGRLRTRNHEREVCTNPGNSPKAERQKWGCAGLSILKDLSRRSSTWVVLGTHVGYRYSQEAYFQDRGGVEGRQQVGENVCSGT